MLFASLSYKGCINIGDDIQSIAVERLLPSVDTHIDRDYLHEYDGPDAFVVLNGWFMERPEGWPPSSSVHPLFFGFHAANDCVFTDLSYLKQWQPIGCRDLVTLEKMHSNGIHAYFTACLTLTLPRPADSIRRSGVYLVDVPDDMLALIPKEIRDRAQRMTHHVPHGLSHAEKRMHARAALDTYAGAELVITRRVHCALPCAAFNTPCWALQTPGNTARLKGFSPFLNIITPDDCSTLDWEHPPSKKDATDVWADRQRDAFSEMVRLRQDGINGALVRDL